MMNDIEFDLIFIIGYFRSALPLLSVARHIKDKRIGVIYAQNDELTNYKVKKYTDKFKDLLIKEDIFTCNEDYRYKTKILIIQEHIYCDLFLKKTSQNITYKYAIGLLGYRLGFDANSKFLQNFKIDICTINDKNLFKLLVEKRNCANIFKKYTILEIGLPYLDYPPFETPKIDWLIASPTTFCFLDYKDLNRYLQNILKIINQVNKNELIAYKSHNGNQKDYLEKFSFLTRCMPKNIILYWFLQYLSEILPLKFGKYFAILSASLIHRIILKRVTPLSDLSENYYLSAEAFIPNVRFGVIGGNSNTIWGTLFYKKKYLNCIDNRNKSLYNSKKADMALNLNLSYFGVPFCENDIKFKMNTKIRDKDLIKLNIVDLLISKLNELD
tara:strand:+ start:153 stop:1307 length:1155 start_codon:yes stop_codon:yes gene_type:complete